MFSYDAGTSGGMTASNRRLPGIGYGNSRTSPFGPGGLAGAGMGMHAPFASPQGGAAAAPNPFMQRLQQIRGQQAAGQPLDQTDAQYNQGAQVNSHPAMLAHRAAAPQLISEHGQGGGFTPQFAHPAAPQLISEHGQGGGFTANPNDPQAAAKQQLLAMLTGGVGGPGQQIQGPQSMIPFVGAGQGASADHSFGRGSGLPVNAQGIQDAFGQPAGKADAIRQAMARALIAAHGAPRPV